MRARRHPRADADAGRLPTTATRQTDELAGILRQRVPNLVTYDDWKTIDGDERHAGKLAGRPRVKHTELDRLLEIATL